MSRQGRQALRQAGRVCPSPSRWSPMLANCVRWSSVVTAARALPASAQFVCLLASRVGRGAGFRGNPVRAVLPGMLVFGASAGPIAIISILSRKKTLLQNSGSGNSGLWVLVKCGRHGHFRGRAAE